MQQVNQLFRALLRVRLEFRQQLLLELDHILNRGTRRAVERAPRAAVEGFIKVDMHVAGGRQHQLAARVVVRQRGVRVIFVIAQGHDFAVLNFHGLLRGASMHDDRALVLKARFKQHVIQIVMAVGNVHGSLRLADGSTGSGRIGHRCGRAKQRGGGDHFAAIA